MTDLLRRNRRPAFIAAALVVLAATAAVVVRGQASAQEPGVVGMATDAGDVNGDGRDDLVRFVRSTGEVYVHLSDGRAAFRAQPRWLASRLLVDGAADKQSYQVLGDFNGDGRSDLAHFVRRTVGDVYVALSTGSSFAAPILAHDNFAYGSEVPAVGDVNGDGYDDLITFGRGSGGDVYVLLSAGDGRTFRVGGAGRVWHDNFAYGSEVPFVGDVNGDGRDDIVTYRHQDTSRVFAALSDGRSFYRPGSHEAPVWLPRITSTESAEPALAVADIDRDGRGDLIVIRNGRVEVWPSDATQFTQPVYYVVDDLQIFDYDETVGLGDFDGNGSTDVAVLRRATGEVRVVATTFPRDAVLSDLCPEASARVCTRAVRSTYLWATGFATYGPGENELARNVSTAPDNRWLGDSRGPLPGN